MAIIVISHQMGAGGPELGMALSSASATATWTRSCSRTRSVATVSPRTSSRTSTSRSRRFFERFDTETRHHITVLQTTLLELAELDNCVFMRGGGQWLLRGVPTCCACRVIAPFEQPRSDSTS